MYVYLPAGNIFTVGFYSPSGEWMAESDWSTSDAAAKRVNFLNGGCCK